MRRSHGAHLYEKAPIKEMIRRSWIAQTDDLKELETAVSKFFEFAFNPRRAGAKLRGSKGLGLRGDLDLRASVTRSPSEHARPFSGLRSSLRGIRQA
jgi:hypothetical protein